MLFKSSAEGPRQRCDRGVPSRSGAVRGRSVGPPRAGRGTGGTSGSAPRSPPTPIPPRGETPARSQGGKKHSVVEEKAIKLNYFGDYGPHAVY